MRKAILGLLDVDLLAAVGAGSDNTVTLAQAQVRAPSDPGYVPTAPPPLGTERALELFTEAGLSGGPHRGRVAGAAAADRLGDRAAGGDPRPHQPATARRCRW